MARKTARNESGFTGWVSSLVHENRKRLAALARKEGLVAEDALDVVQDAFCSYLDLPQARLIAGDPEAARRLLMVLTKNAARNRRRKHDRARPHDELGELASADPSVDELIARAEAHAQAVGCAYHLSEVQRRVVTLRLLDDLPGEAAARALKLSTSNVGILLHRAKNQLRECMASAGYADAT
jgi:RNA polymerase sigma-70 factor (ECF subfamily)